VLFSLTGFGPTRLLLPAGLRRHELLWVAPVGAMALALELTLLGYAYVPFDVSLAIVITGSLALGAYAWRTSAWVVSTWPRTRWRRSRSTSNSAGIWPPTPRATSR